MELKIEITTRDNAYLVTEIADMSLHVDDEVTDEQLRRLAAKVTAVFADGIAAAIAQTRKDKQLEPLLSLLQGAKHVGIEHTPVAADLPTGDAKWPESANLPVEPDNGVDQEAGVTDPA